MAKYKVQPDLEIEQTQRLFYKPTFNLKTTPSQEIGDDRDEPPECVIERKHSLAVVRVTRPFRRCWDLLTNLLCLYTCISIPFFLSFSLPLDSHFNTIQSVIDFVFTFDICLNFFTTYIDSKGKEVLVSKKIVRKYLKGAFWLDVAATLPIDNIAVAVSPASTIVKVLLLKDMIRGYRILTLPAMVRYTRVADEMKALLRLLVIIVYLLLIAHLFGCFWFTIVQEDKTHAWLPVPDFLSGETYVFEDDLWGQYSMVFYHSVWLLVGGEVGARNGLTAMCAACMITIGTVITAMLFGEMEVLASTLNRRQTQFQEAFDSALTTTKGMKLPTQTVNRILDHITSSQSQHNAQEEFETFMKFVSPSLRKEATGALYTPIIDSNPVLQGDSRLTKFLQQCMKTRFTEPEEEIITEGTPGDSLYLILNGRFAVIVVDRRKAKHTVKHLESGALLGEIALVYDTVRTATVVSVGYGIVAHLARRDFERMANLFPELVGKLRRQVREYRDPWKDFVQETAATIDFVKMLQPHFANELPYLMEFRKLEKGSYLFKPGDKLSQVYLVAEGLLELAVTINEKSLHVLKNQSLPPKDREPGPPTLKKRLTFQSYAEYEVPVEVLYRLKKRAELLPVYKRNRVIGAIQIDELLPQSTSSVGEYPQEIVIEEVGPGTVIGERGYSLEDVSLIQCKAVKSSKVYVLSKGLIDRMKSASVVGAISKSDRTLKEDLEKSPKFAERLILDYHYIGDEHLLIRRRWKSAIMSVIFSNRERLSTGMSFIAHMLPKLKAIIACENGGNFSLAAKVSRDEVPPHHILEDGTLDPTMRDHSQGKNASLPLSHPIIKVFRKASAAVSHPTGTMMREFSRIAATLQDNKSELRGVRKDANYLHYTLLKVLTNLGDTSVGSSKMQQMAAESGREAK